MYPPELRFTGFGRPVLIIRFLSGEYAEAWDVLAEQMTSDDRLFETGRVVTVNGKSRVREWTDITGLAHSVSVLTITEYSIND